MVEASYRQDACLEETYEQLGPSEAGLGQEFRYWNLGFDSLVVFNGLRTI
jgi:hypothetical protein